MNFTYIYAEDPLREKLQGNITWLIPEFDTPAHWMHTEDICKFFYYKRVKFPHLMRFRLALELIGMYPSR